MNFEFQILICYSIYVFTVCSMRDIINLYILKPYLVDHSLTFSNKLRQTLTYKAYVKYFINSRVRSSIFRRFGLFRIATVNKFINHEREYWYIGSIFANVSIVKNNLVE